MFVPLCVLFRRFHTKSCDNNVEITVEKIDLNKQNFLDWFEHSKQPSPMKSSVFRSVSLKKQFIIYLFMSRFIFLITTLDEWNFMCSISLIFVWNCSEQQSQIRQKECIFSMWRLRTTFNLNFFGHSSPLNKRSCVFLVCFLF